jgi:hypothetical protein
VPSTKKERIVGLTQAFTRPGFDFSRHTLSLLENGDLGWIQITSFLLGLPEESKWDTLAACVLTSTR